MTKKRTKVIKGSEIWMIRHHKMAWFYYLLMALFFVGLCITFWQIRISIIDPLLDLTSDAVEEGLTTIMMIGGLL